MSSIDHQQDSMTEQEVDTAASLRIPGLVTEQSPAEQLSFPNYFAPPGGSQAPFSQHPVAPMMTRPLTDSTSTTMNTASDTSPNMMRALMVPSVTRELTEQQTGALSSVLLPQATMSLRQPVLIRGNGTKSAGLRPPRKERRVVVHVAVTAVLALIVLSALFVGVPVGDKGHASLFKVLTGGGGMDIISMKSNNTAMIAQQAATATAVTQDGYDPGNVTYVGVPTAPPSLNSGGGNTVDSPGSTLNRFFYGQCTYWANMRYHALTGYWVPWLGNADEWSGQAYNYGWTVSSRPKVPSIIVLQPYVEGAYGYGHVAVVERINADGSVYASNWNFAVGGGGFAILSYATFYPGAGVSFVSHP